MKKSWTRSIFLSAFLSATLIASFISAGAHAFPVQVATAPDNTLPLILGAIGSARHSLLVNIYELASPEIAQALIDQINRGLHVEILQEGEPVGGVAAAARGLHAQIAQAMESHPGCCRYAEMHKGAGGTRRFHFDHAKYIVVDQDKLLLGSENYSPGGHPEPGTIGNRGWEVFVADSQPSRWFAQIFAKDSDPRQPDIQSLLKARSHVSALPPMTSVPAPRGRANPIFDATDGEIITSPDTSLNGLVGLIQNARQSLDIEQMSFNMNWGGETSPLAHAIIAAARRHVRVRILLNDEYAFAGAQNQGGDGTDGNGPDGLQDFESSTNGKTTINRKTVAALMQLARSERLPMEARIANLQAMGVNYIHNKGMIVDGKITLISSINWTQNSITNNREAALALTSPQIAAYFGQAFTQDWSRSGGTVGALEMELAPTEPKVISPECPSALRVSAQIGDLKTANDLDPSYLMLQHQTLSGAFTRDLHDKRCILLGPGNFVLELRNDPNGNLDADLEGFTSSFKPFSIRAEFDPNTHLTLPGTHVSAQGQLLEGNSAGGGRKRRLGPAMLNLESRQEKLSYLQ